MSEPIHFFYSGVGIACRFVGICDVAYAWRRVSCRSCLSVGIERHSQNAVARLAELDQEHSVAQPQPDTYDMTFTPLKYACDVDLNLADIKVAAAAVNNTSVAQTITASIPPSQTFTITVPNTLEWGMPAYGSITLPGRIDQCVTTIGVDPDARDTLLLRAASFIADLPSGALDRNRNVEAMAIRRAIADLVVGKDKVSK